MDHTIAQLDIREMLDESNMSYLMLLDFCYDCRQTDPELISQYIIDRTGTDTVNTLMGDVFGIFDAMFTMTWPDTGRTRARAVA